MNADSKSRRSLFGSFRDCATGLFAVLLPVILVVYIFRDELEPVFAVITLAVIFIIAWIMVVLRLIH